MTEKTEETIKPKKFETSIVNSKVARMSAGPPRMSMRQPKANGIKIEPPASATST